MEGILLVVVAVGVVHVECACMFPENLLGPWYQKDVGDVQIGPSNMTHKGHCVENKDDYYLMHNREMGCFQCLEVSVRHRNIIQYKESYCGGRDSLETICSRIKEHNLQYTMVREKWKRNCESPSPRPNSDCADEGYPVRCPFQDAYHFSYNNNTGGFCRDPTSYVKSCASDAKFRFHFKHCPNAAYTFNQDLDYECMATWSDGSDMYMYGKFNGPGIQGKERSYRCFIYQILGTVVYLAMSGDSTCRGLRSPRDGPLVMEFTKDVFGWPQPACAFPSWVTRYTWRDLSGHHMYMTNTEGSVLSVRYKYPDGRSDVRTAFRCVRVIQDDADGRDNFIAMSFTSDECSPRFQCLMFIKRRDGVTEIHQGSYMEYDTDQCTSKNFDNATKRLLFPAPTLVTSCPFPGLHRMTDLTHGCSGYIQSGCNGSSTMDIVAPCSSQPKVQLECLKSWGGKRRQFIVASRLGERTSVANCFVMKQRGDRLQFSTDRNCNIGTTDIFNIAVKYTVDPKQERCIVTQKPKPKFRPEVESRHNTERATEEQKDEGKNPYRHVDSKDKPQSQVANSSCRWLHGPRSTLCIFCDMFVAIWLLHRTLL